MWSVLLVKFQVTHYKWLVGIEAHMEAALNKNGKDLAYNDFSLSYLTN